MAVGHRGLAMRVEAGVIEREAGRSMGVGDALCWDCDVALPLGVEPSGTESDAAATIK